MQFINSFRAGQRSDRFILLIEGQARVHFPKVNLWFVFSEGKFVFLINKKMALCHRQIPYFLSMQFDMKFDVGPFGIFWYASAKPAQRSDCSTQEILDSINSTNGGQQQQQIQQWQR